MNCELPVSSLFIFYLLRDDLQPIALLDCSSVTLVYPNNATHMLHAAPPLPFCIRVGLV